MLFIRQNITFPFLLQNGLTPLHIAAHYGHVDITELLLNRGADTDARARVYSPSHGFSPDFVLWLGLILLCFSFPCIENAGLVTWIE